MPSITDVNVDLFADTLPGLDQLYKLHSAVWSSEALAKQFAEELDTRADSQGCDHLRVGIGYAIIDRNNQAIEHLGQANDCAEKYLYMAWSQRKKGAYDAAIQSLEKAEADFGADSVYVLFEKAAVLRDAGRYDDALPLLEGRADLDGNNADYSYFMGRICEAQGRYDAAADQYRKALNINPSHSKALFHLAFACDLRGDETAAIDYYKQLISKGKPFVSALLNLAVLYEDRGEFEKAANCIHRVLSSHPNHRRAILFSKDIESSKTMFYDEEREKRMDRRNQIMEIPITDFELSVRSRNCLKKMNINTLGDLARISESELLSYKNFGETSLREIKQIMEIKGLRLGCALEDKGEEYTEDYSPDEDEELMNKPVDELDLSVRAKKALDRLGVTCVGDLARKTEAELLGCKNFGITSLNEIKIALNSIGVDLRKLD